MRKILSRLLILVLGTATMVALLFILRKPILRSLAAQLVEEDSLVVSQQIVVLSGHAEERAPEAAKLLRAQLAPSILVTGAVTPRIFREMGIVLSEADLTSRVLKQHNVDSVNITFLREGTSTWEECNALTAYAKKNNVHSLILVSSRFHTQRMQWVANRTLRASGIRVIIRGARPTSFSEDVWWESEDGLLFVVNEYLKLIYYSYKYSS